MCFDPMLSAQLSAELDTTLARLDRLAQDAQLAQDALFADRLDQLDRLSSILNAMEDALWARVEAEAQEAPQGE